MTRTICSAPEKPSCDAWDERKYEKDGSNHQGSYAHVWRGALREATCKTLNELRRRETETWCNTEFTRELAFQLKVKRVDSEFVC